MNTQAQQSEDSTTAVASASLPSSEETRSSCQGRSPVLTAVLCSAAVFAFLAAIGFALFGYSLADLGPGVVAALAMILVLALAGEFSQITIGSVLSLKREVSFERTRANEYREQARDLRASFASLTASMQQTQTTATRIHNGNVYVRAAPPETVEAKRDDQLGAGENQVQPTATPPAAAGESTPIEGTEAADERRSRRQLAMAQVEAALKQFAASVGMSREDLVPWAEIKSPGSIDPISNYSPLFDAYLKKGSEEFFIEIVFSTPEVARLRSRFYELISKVFLYRQSSRDNVRLVVIIVPSGRTGSATPDETQRRLSDVFGPAIASGIVEFRIDDSPAPPLAG